MKRNTFGLVLVGATFIGTISPVSAEDLKFMVGYRFINLDYTFNHDTHQDDSFLTGAIDSGSAGTTNLGNIHWAFLGGRYQTKKADLILNFDFGVLLGGERDRRKNVNDTRPDANAAFIYSEAHVGVLAAFGLSYDMNPLTLGAEAQVTGVFIESGWDRWGSDDKQDSMFEVMPTIGPKIGYQLSENIGLEATIQFGKSTNGAANLIFGF